MGARLLIQSTVIRPRRPLRHTTWPAPDPSLYPVKQSTRRTCHNTPHRITLLYTQKSAHSPSGHLFKYIHFFFSSSDSTQAEATAGAMLVVQARALSAARSAPAGLVGDKHKQRRKGRKGPGQLASRPARIASCATCVRHIKRRWSGSVSGASLLTRATQRY